MLADSEVIVNFSALMVSLIKAKQFDAAEALWDWAEEWLDVDRDDAAELLELGDEPGA